MLTQKLCFGQALFPPLALTGKAGQKAKNTPDIFNKMSRSELLSYMLSQLR